MSTRLLLAFLLLTSSFASVPPSAEPIVAVWYRGNPAGTPRQSDLGAIRALGFNAVVWPKAARAGLAELEKLAPRVGLKVIAAAAPVPATAHSTLAPSDRVDIVVTPATAPAILSLSWRAVSHGARTIAFDSRSAAGAGLEQPDGSLKPWVRTAIQVARELTANASLATAMRAGPAVHVSPSRASLDVVMLDADRAWVIVATNGAGAPLKADVRLPKGTPYALWVSWLEGPPLAMVSEAAGPRWVLALEPYGTRVYMIDKKMR